MSSTPHPPVTSLPARFSIERLLGEGAAATTYLARDRVLDRLVVIKSLHGRWSDDPVARARFEREARAAAAIDHPHVVGVYDYGAHQGSAYLVLRYVEGGTLRRQLTAHGRLSADEATRIVGQILAGLDVIHAAGLVHRDVKPENVLVGTDGLLRLTDFGIAVAVVDPRLTTHGQIWGTPAYMAPEQALGRPVSAATDVYAVGIVLFELLTGRLPFIGNEAAAVALAQVSFPPPALREVNPATDAAPALEAVLRRALAKDPRQRYQTAAAMAQALASAQGAPAPDASGALDARPTVPLPAARGDDQRTVPLQVVPSRPARRSRWVAAMLGILVLGAVAAVLGSDGALWFWSQGGGVTPPPRANGGGTATQAAHLVQTVSTATSAVTPTRETSGAAIPRPTRTTPTETPTARPTSIETPLPTDTSTPAATREPPPTDTPAPTATEPVPIPAATDTPAPTATEPVPTPAATAPPPPTVTAAPSTDFGNDILIVPGEPARIDAPGANEQPTVDAGAGDGSQPDDSAIANTDLPAQPIAQQFSAADWQGGYVGDQSWYGRPWVAIYGAQSQYPRAALTFPLDAAPTGDATLDLEGLDDEWPGNVSIEITVNGAAIFSGPSPWQSWDGAGHGEDAAWTTVVLTIPAGTLHAGINQLVVSNTEPAANFETGPYVLLSAAAVVEGAP